MSIPERVEKPSAEKLMLTQLESIAASLRLIVEMLKEESKRRKGR